MLEQQLRLCFVAPSGSGKSTSAQLLKAALARRGRSVGIYKLAAPLYETQALIYRNSGCAIGEGEQHQGILEGVARYMRALNPCSIVDHFLRRLEVANEDVVINDDLRDEAVDLPALRRHGFYLIKVSTSRSIVQRRLSARRDPHSLYETPLNAQLARMVPDYVLVNDADSLERLTAAVELLADELHHSAKPVVLGTPTSTPTRPPESYR